MSETHRIPTRIAATAVFLLFPALAFPAMLGLWLARGAVRHPVGAGLVVGVPALVLAIAAVVSAAVR